MRPIELAHNARRNRAIARGYRLLRRNKAQLYEAAAQAFERLETRSKTLEKVLEKSSDRSESETAPAH